MSRGYFLDSRARSEFKAAARCEKSREDQVNAIQVMIARTVPQVRSQGEVRISDLVFQFDPLWMFNN